MHWEDLWSKLSVVTISLELCFYMQPLEKNLLKNKLQMYRRNKPGTKLCCPQCWADSLGSTKVKSITILICTLCSVIGLSHVRSLFKTVTIATIKCRNRQNAGCNDQTRNGTMTQLPFSHYRPTSHGRLGFQPRILGTTAAGRPPGI